MALTLVTGSSGSGKSQYIYERMIQEAIQNPKENYIVLVPEQFSMQTQKEIIRMHPNKGLLNIDVLSFQRLAYRIFGEVGGCRKTVLEETGKSLLIQSVVYEQQRQLGLLKGTLKKAGAVSHMKSLISEFLQYQISPEDLELYLEDASDGPLTRKLRDIVSVYRGFLSKINKEYMTAEEVPELLCQVMDASLYLKGSTIVLDGFTGFTPVQLPVLKKLLKACRMVYAVVTIDGRESLYKKGSAFQLFSMSRDMVKVLTKLANESGVEVLSPIQMKDGELDRFKNNPVLKALEQNLFRDRWKAVQMPGELVSQNLTIHEYPDPRKEIQRVAEKIKRIVREDGYAYGEIAIVTGDMESYGPEIAYLFRREAIPCFLDQKYSILENPLVEFLRASVDLLVKSFSYESVFRLLRTGFLDFTGDEIDLLENYCLALGIRGRSRFQERWVRTYQGMRDGEIDEMNHLRQLFVDRVMPFAEHFSKRGSTVLEKTKALYQFVIDANVESQLGDAANAFKEAGNEAKVREYEQILPIVVRLLEKYVEVMGDEKVSMTEYQQVLDAGLKETKFGLIPPGSDQVLVGDIERTRLKDIKVLFFIGVNDGLVPKAVDKGGLLNETDRDRLKEAELSLAKGEKEELCQQRFYLYLSLSKPSDRLYISYCCTDFKGGSALPSYLISTLKGLFPQLEIQHEEDLPLSMSLESKRGQMELFLDGLRKISHQDPDDVWLELYMWYRQDQERSKLLDRLLFAAFYENPASGIGRAAAKKLYGDVISGSATNLEQFSACAFSYFLKYGLALREREEYLFQGPDWGNLLHNALDRFSGLLQKKQLDFVSLTEEERVALSDEAIEDLVHDFKNTVLHSSKRMEHMIARAKSTMYCTVWALQEQLKRGNFVPGGFELAFGEKESLKAFHQELSDGSRIALKGRIDRMDLCDDGDRILVKIIDYKTGKKELDLVLLYYGLQLQLSVYMNAALEINQKKYPDKAVEPAGVFYYRIQDPFVSGDGDPDQKRLKELRMNGLFREEEDVLRLLDHDLLPQEDSLVMKAKRNKNGELAKGAQKACIDTFRDIASFTERKIRAIGEQIMEGKVSVNPYILGKEDACEFCRFKNICGYDAEIPGFAHRQLKKYNQDEVLNKIREE